MTDSPDVPDDSVDATAEDLGPVVARRIEAPTTSVGGVISSEIPTIFVQSDTISAAGIVFQGGRGHEVVAASGVSHLIKHLVCNHAGLSPHGPVDPYAHDATGFSFVGPTDELVENIAEVSLALSVLPLDGLQTARDEVSAESEGWHPSIIDHLMRIRHGVQGPGSTALEEYGIRKVGEKQLTHFANRYFHRDNAVIWHVGPEPTRFRTRLVHGVRPLSSPPPLPVPTPGATFGNPGEVALSILVPRDTASQALANIAEQRAMRELVERRKISSAVIFSAERRTPWVDEVVGYANASEGFDDEVARVMLWALDSLEHEPATEDELNTFRAIACAPYFDHANVADFAMENALALVTKATVPTWPEKYHALTELDSEKISSAIADAMSTMLIVGSRACTVLDERFEYVGNWAPTEIEGANVRPMPVSGETKVDRSLVFGPKGLVVREHDRITSVRFSDCTLMLRDEGGYRELISTTGGRAVFIADAWENGDRLLKTIDKEIPIERTIVMDENHDQKGGYVGGIERRRWPR